MGKAGAPKKGRPLKGRPLRSDSASRGMPTVALGKNQRKAKLKVLAKKTKVGAKLSSVKSKSKVAPEADDSDTIVPARGRRGQAAEESVSGKQSKQQKLKAAAERAESPASTRLSRSSSSSSLAAKPAGGKKTVAAKGRVEKKKLKGSLPVAGVQGIQKYLTTKKVSPTAKNSAVKKPTQAAKSVQNEATTPKKEAASASDSSPESTASSKVLPKPTAGKSTRFDKLDSMSVDNSEKTEEALEEEEDVLESDSKSLDENSVKNSSNSSVTKADEDENIQKLTKRNVSRLNPMENIGERRLRSGSPASVKSTRSLSLQRNLPKDGSPTGVRNSTRSDSGLRLLRNGKQSKAKGALTETAKRKKGLALVFKGDDDRMDDSRSDFSDEISSIFSESDSSSFIETPTRKNIETEDKVEAEDIPDSEDDASIRGMSSPLPPPSFPQPSVNKKIFQTKSSPTIQNKELDTQEKSLPKPVIGDVPTTAGEFSNVQPSPAVDPDLESPKEAAGSSPHENAGSSTQMEEVPKAETVAIDNDELLNDESCDTLTELPKSESNSGKNTAILNDIHTDWDTDGEDNKDDFDEPQSNAPKDSKDGTSTFDELLLSSPRAVREKEITNPSNCFSSSDPSFPTENSKTEDKIDEAVAKDSVTNSSSDSAGEHKLPDPIIIKPSDGKNGFAESVDFVAKKNPRIDFELLRRRTKRSMSFNMDASEKANQNHRILTVEPNKYQGVRELYWTVKAVREPILPKNAKQTDKNASKVSEVQQSKSLSSPKSGTETSIKDNQMETAKVSENESVSLSLCDSSLKENIATALTPLRESPGASPSRDNVLSSAVLKPSLFLPQPKACDTALETAVKEKSLTTHSTQLSENDPPKQSSALPEVNETSPGNVLKAGPNVAGNVPVKTTIYTPTQRDSSLATAVKTPMNEICVAGDPAVPSANPDQDPKTNEAAEERCATPLDSQALPKITQQTPEKLNSDDDDSFHLRLSPTPTKGDGRHTESSVVAVESRGSTSEAGQSEERTEDTITELEGKAIDACEEVLKEESSMSSINSDCNKNPDSVVAILPESQKNSPNPDSVVPILPESQKNSPLAVEMTCLSVSTEENKKIEVSVPVCQNTSLEEFESIIKDQKRNQAKGKPVNLKRRHSTSSVNPQLVDWNEKEESLETVLNDTEQILKMTDPNLPSQNVNLIRATHASINETTSTLEADVSENPPESILSEEAKEMEICHPDKLTTTIPESAVLPEQCESSAVMEKNLDMSVDCSTPAKQIGLLSPRLEADVERLHLEINRSDIERKRREITEEEQSPEKRKIKEWVLSSLGLQSIAAAAAAATGTGPPSKRRSQDGVSSGRLKTVIKVPKENRKDKKGERKPLRMVFKNGKPYPGGSWDTPAEGKVLEADSTFRLEGNTPPDVSSSTSMLNGPDYVASSNLLLADTSAPMLGGEPDGKGKPDGNLVIPEKSSSFSIHPGRLCSDVCSYCFGKFGSLDTPCHVAQLKSRERQMKIMSVETHLAMDSCLCDACIRYVDRKANCPSAKPQTSHRKESKNRFEGSMSSCIVSSCVQPARHSLRKKWYIKIRKSVMKMCPIDLDLAHQHLPLPLCPEHYSYMEYFMVCGLCKRRLSRGHMYNLSNTREINICLEADGIPARLSDKLFVCKLCRYYATLRVKHPGSHFSLSTNQREFFNSYRKRILRNHDIEVSDDEGVEEPEIPNDHFVPEENTVPEEAEVQSKGKRKRAKSSGASLEYDGTEQSKKKSRSEHGGKGKEKTGSRANSRERETSAPLAVTAPEQPPPPVIVQIKTTKSGKSSKTKQGSESAAAAEWVRKGLPPFYPGENELALHAKFQFQYKDAPSEGREWEKCTSTLQFDKETKKLWQELQRPYGSQSSFLRHLVLMERYWRQGELVLAPEASARATSYTRSVQNRLKAYGSSFTVKNPVEPVKPSPSATPTPPPPPVAVVPSPATAAAAAAADLKGGTVLTAAAAAAAVTAVHTHAQLSPASMHKAVPAVSPAACAVPVVTPAIASKPSLVQVVKPSNSMQVVTKSSNAVQTAGKLSSSVQAGGKSASTVQVGGKSSSTVQVAGKSSSTLQVGGKSSSTVQVGGKLSSNMQVAGKSSTTLQVLVKPSNSMEVGVKPSNAMQVTSKSSNLVQDQVGYVVRQQQPLSRPSSNPSVSLVPISVVVPVSSSITISAQGKTPALGKPSAVQAVQLKQPPKAIAPKTSVSPGNSRVSATTWEPNVLPQGRNPFLSSSPVVNLTRSISLTAIPSTPTTVPDLHPISSEAVTITRPSSSSSNLVASSSSSVSVSTSRGTSGGFVSILGSPATTMSIHSVRISSSALNKPASITPIYTSQSLPSSVSVTSTASSPVTAVAAVPALSALLQADATKVGSSTATSSLRLDATKMGSPVSALSGLQIDASKLGNSSGKVHVTAGGKSFSLTIQQFKKLQALRQQRQLDQQSKMRRQSAKSDKERRDSDTTITPIPSNSQKSDLEVVDVTGSGSGSHHSFTPTISAVCSGDQAKAMWDDDSKASEVVSRSASPPMVEITPISSKAKLGMGLLPNLPKALTVTQITGDAPSTPLPLSSSSSSSGMSVTITRQNCQTPLPIQMSSPALDIFPN